ncbi:glycosyltransferase family 87 protein [Hymenobacter sp. B1770]|uniref:glycosyltransferase family 87 protein n=1 Tax=Hymenobacter sp. B1770 TaxID=1718788 RepID=UPI003CFA6540
MPNFALRLRTYLLNPYVLGAVYAVLTVIISVQHYLKGPGSYNNYLIFVKPFFNLLAEKNLYLEYPDYYYDTYKYSPTFALFMGPLALIPAWLGLMIWNVVNSAVFYFAARRMFPDTRRQAIFLLLVFFDVLTALHNSQANCLLAGLMMWTYVHLKDQRAALAGLCLALAAFIKVYGIAVGLLFLFYPGFWRNTLWAAAWMVVLAFMPLLVVSWPAFLMIYKGWYDIVRESATGIQLSVIGILQSWFGFPLQYKGIVQALGMGLLLLPLVRWRSWSKPDYQRLYLCSLLIFVVIFNQMAESPTFIIAVTGFMLWFIYYGRYMRLGWPLFWFAFIFTSISSTDLMPSYIRETYLDVYKMKAVPMVVAWLVIQVQLLLLAWHRSQVSEELTASDTSYLASEGTMTR